MLATVSEIHRYPLRPPGFEEPLFATARSRRAVAEHLARATWLSRGSDLRRGSGQAAHSREEPVHVLRRADGRAYLVHDTGILAVLNAQTGKEIYKVRVGGGGHTFSASPVAAGNRIFMLTEEGLTFVLDSGDEYKEIAKNDLGEMSLASPAVAGGAIYIRTESKLYRIGGADSSVQFRNFLSDS